jgi:hypothetical protein
MSARGKAQVDVLLRLVRSFLHVFGPMNSMRSRMGGYLTETALLDEFLCHLERFPSPWGAVQVAREFFYRNGRTDVIALASDGCVLAFEAKLERWRAALHQAYRNTCFAHRSYVVLPKEVALRAQRYTAEFDRRGVGLCYVDKEGLVVLKEATKSEPIQPWLSGLATSHASGGVS